MSNKKIVLAKTADWDAWISFVRSRATKNGIWDLINPDLDVKPASLTMPTKPEYVMPANDTDFNIVTYNAFKARKNLYKTDLALYEQQLKSFGDIITFIQEAVAVHNVTFIQKEEPHPWNHLLALKRRLAPNDDALCLQIGQKYHQLCKGPGTQDIETYLDHWTTTYTEVKERNIGEVTGTGPIRDFLRAIRTKEPTFADTRMMMLGIRKEAEDLYGVIEDFRQHIRLHQFDHPGKRESHSAFVADTDPKPTFRQLAPELLSGPSKPSICDDTHWLSDCYYLLPDRGWNPKSDKQKKGRRDREIRTSGGASGTTTSAPQSFLPHDSNGYCQER